MLILFSAALFGLGLLLVSLGLAVLLLGLAIRIAICLFQLGLLLVWASIIAARHWLQQRRKLAVLLLLLLTGMLLGAAPAYAYDLPQDYLDALADAVPDYCANHFCHRQEEIPNWWTPHGKGTYWDNFAPTMADAPRWLKYPPQQQRRMRRR